MDTFSNEWCLTTDDEQYVFFSFTSKYCFSFDGEMTPQNAQMANGQAQETESAMQLECEQHGINPRLFYDYEWH
jgi:hypothetical protein